MRFVKFLPAGGAFMAHVAADPQTPDEGEAEPWRAFYGWSLAERLSADLWDLLARVNTPKGKKSPEYPVPGRKNKKQKRPVKQRRGHDGRGVMVDG